MNLLTVGETARLLRVSPITVRRYIKSGRLAAVQVGRGVRVDRAAIDRFVAPFERVGAAVESPGASGKPTTILEGLGDIVAIGRSGEPTDIATHKDEYLADAFAPVAAEKE